jgi:kynurenine formamidase
MHAAATPRRFVDLSHSIVHGMVTYPGLPAPVVSEYLSRDASRERYAPGTEFHIGRIEMVANTGTYLDSPFHRYEGARDLAELPLESLADLVCVVVRTVGAAERAIDRIPCAPEELRGAAVLFHTGWDAHWGTPRYAEGHPFLTAGLAERIADCGVALVGIDSLNIDATDGGTRPVHSTLLARDVRIVEHLCGLERLPDRGARFFAVPPKVRGLGTFPVRAFALV